MTAERVLKIALAVLIAVIIVYVIVYFFIYGDKSTNANYQNFANSINSNSRVSTYGTDPTLVPLDGILINLSGGKYKYMKADLSLKMDSKRDKEDIEKNISYVRDLILRYSATKKSDELESEAGKEQFKKELKSLIYDKLGYEVKDIYFRNFVLAP